MYSANDVPAEPQVSPLTLASFVSAQGQRQPLRGAHGRAVHRILRPLALTPRFFRGTI